MQEGSKYVKDKMGYLKSEFGVNVNLWWLVYSLMKTDIKFCWISYFNDGIRSNFQIKFNVDSVLFNSLNQQTLFLICIFFLEIINLLPHGRVFPSTLHLYLRALVNLCGWCFPHKGYFVLWTLEFVVLLEEVF